MNKYRTRYDAKGKYGISYETINARGLVHAFKLAKDHLKEIRKLTKNDSIRISLVSEEKEAEET